jgi:hypothetical protein
VSKPAVIWDRLIGALLRGKASESEMRVVLAIALNPSDKPRGRRTLGELARLSEHCAWDGLLQADANGRVVLESVATEKENEAGRTRYIARIAPQFCRKTGTATVPVAPQESGTATVPVEEAASDDETGGNDQSGTGNVPVQTGTGNVPLGPGADLATRAHVSKASLNSSSSYYLPKEQTTSSSNGDAAVAASAAEEETDDALPWPDPKANGKPPAKPRAKAATPRTPAPFDPTKLEPAVYRLWCGIVLFRWRLDNVPEKHAREAADVAAWLVENRAATPEELEDWHRWWWKDPDGMGCRNQTRPWPKNVRNDWDTAKGSRPEAELEFPPNSPLAGAMDYRRDARARVARLREEEARKEPENDVRRIN